jgi:hypothetical protein
VGGAQAGETGGLVASTGLDTDETVLDLSGVSDVESTLCTMKLTMSIRPTP